MDDAQRDAIIAAVPWGAVGDFVDDLSEKGVDEDVALREAARLLDELAVLPEPLETFDRAVILTALRFGWDALHVSPERRAERRARRAARRAKREG